MARSMWSFIHYGIIIVLLNCCLMMYLQFSRFPKGRITFLRYQTRGNNSRAVDDITDYDDLYIDRGGFGQRLDHQLVLNKGKLEGLYRINQEHKCSAFQAINVLILVMSNGDGGYRRTAIRQTWGKTFLDDGRNTGEVLLFLVRPTNNKSIIKTLHNESSEHNDIVQSNFKTNILSHDVSVVLHWVRTYCVNARYILTIDDRTLVLRENLMLYMANLPKTDFVGWNRQTYSSTHGKPAYTSQSVNSSSAFGNSTISVRIQHEECGHPYLQSMDVLLRASILVERDRSKFINVYTYFHMLQNTMNLSVSDMNAFDVYGARRTYCSLKSVLLSCNVQPNRMYSLWQTLGNPVLAQTAANYTKPSEDFKDTLEDKRMQAVFSHIKFLSGDKGRCLKSKNIYILLVTVSHPNNRDARRTIRNTRRQLSEITGRTIKQMFLIEKSGNKKTDNEVRKECSQFNDIIFTDSKHSGKKDKFTPSILKILKWWSLYCPKVTYIMKVTDEAFVNLRRTVKLLLGQPNSCLFIGSMTNKTISENTPVNSVPQQWSGQDLLIPDGHAYIMSVEDVAKEIGLSIRHETVLFPEDDFLGTQLHYLGISPVHHDGFDRFGEKQSVCDLIQIISSNRMSSSQIYAKWRELEEWGEFKRCRGSSQSASKHNLTEGIIVENGRVFGLEPPTKEYENGPFLINNRNKCKTLDSESPDVFMLVGVLTHPDNKDMRIAIRETWAMSRNVSGYRIETLFFVGVNHNQKQQMLIEKENLKYGDIIQSNFVESYQHLILKTLSIIEWASDYCKEAKYVIKVDDDVFLNYFNLVEFLMFSPRKDFYMGEVKSGTQAIRSVSSKWYTPYEVWPRKIYPPYANGPSYILSMDVVKRIQKTVRETPIFKWEDVYIGVITQQLKVMPYPHIHFDHESNYRHPCLISEALASHGITETLTRQFWAILKSPPKKEKCIELKLEKLKPRFNPPSIGEHSTNTSKLIDVNVYPRFQYFSDFKSPPTPPFLIVFIMTSPDEYYRRKYFRLVFGNLGPLTKQIMIRFIMGASYEHGVQGFVRNENELYGDILHERFFESQKHYSQKFMTAIQWASKQSAQYVMLIDHNIHVNVKNVMQHLNVAPKSRYVLCHKRTNKPVERSPRSEWFVSMKEWKEEVFPPYCDSQAAIIMSYDIVKIIKEQSNRPVLKFPEFYFGMVLNDFNITILDGKEFKVEPLNDKQLSDSVFCTITKNYFTIYGLTPNTIHFMLKRLLSDIPKKC